MIRFGYWLRYSFGEYGLSLRCSGVGSQVVCGEVLVMSRNRSFLGGVLRVVILVCWSCR